MAIASVDRENIVRAAQTAKLLADDIHALVSSDNVLLADVALDLIELANRLQQRLGRLEVITRTDQ